jgi:hypothetical protein
VRPLLVSERRKRVTPDLTKSFLEDLQRLPVDIDYDVTASVVFVPIQTLGRKRGLSAYDAAYAEGPAGDG